MSLLIGDLNSVWDAQSNTLQEREKKIQTKQLKILRKPSSIYKEKYLKEKNKTRHRDHTGTSFGSLVAIRRVGTSRSAALWECLCKCGKKVKVRADCLVGGATKSCGCFAREASTFHGHTTNGKVSTEYRSWAALRSRCLSKSNPAWKDYGGRGITVDHRWNFFSNFYEDMGPKPSKFHSIDRIDNEKGYTKENCRWATAKDQANNRRKQKKHSRNTRRYLK